MTLNTLGTVARLVLIRSIAAEFPDQVNTIWPTPYGQHYVAHTIWPMLYGQQYILSVPRPGRLH